MLKWSKQKAMNLSIQQADSRTRLRSWRRTSLSSFRKWCFDCVLQDERQTQLHHKCCVPAKKFIFVGVWISNSESDFICLNE